MSDIQKIREGMLKLLCGYGGDVRIENCNGCLAYDKETNRCRRADKFLQFLAREILEILLAHKEYQTRWKGRKQILFGFSPDEIDKLRDLLKEEK